MVGTNWRFLRPVKPGMTVHAVWRLGRLREVSNARWGLAVWQVELDDQNEERVLEGEVTVLVNRRQVAAPAATRSRRRRRGKALPTAPGLTAEANLPEPAPADSPAPARRGRRPATAPLAPATPVAAGEPPVADAVSSTEVGAASPASATTTSSRRRRRRRGGGGGTAATAGNGNGTAGGQVQPGAVPVEVAPAPAPAEPARSQWAAPEAAKPTDNNPVSRVLGRLRRSRSRPVAPSPEGTRSPSE
jgi:hypothetical protein